MPSPKRWSASWSSAVVAPRPGGAAPGRVVMIPIRGDRRARLPADQRSLADRDRLVVGVATTSSQTVKVLLPELGESVTEGVVVEWRVQEGDAVAAGDTLLDVTTDKVDVEVPAPAAGRRQDRGRPGETVEVGALLAELSTGNGAAAVRRQRRRARHRRRARGRAAAGAARRRRPPAEPEAAPAPPPRTRSPASWPDRPPRHGVGDRGHRRRVARGRRRRRRVGADPRWRSRPTRWTSRCPRPPRAASPPSRSRRGRRSRWASRWGTSRPAPPARRPPAARRRAAEQARPARRPGRQRPAPAGAELEWPKISPVARRLALEHGVNPGTLTAPVRRDDPQGGRRRRRVRRPRARRRGPPTAAAPAAAPPPARRPCRCAARPPRSPATWTTACRSRRPPASARSPWACSTRQRRKINGDLKAAGRTEKLSFTHLIAWAIVRAVEARPVMGTGFTVVDGKPNKLVRGAVNLGLAVDVERKDGSRSLLVPVVRDAGAAGFDGFRPGLRRPGGAHPRRAGQARRAARRVRHAHQPGRPRHRRLRAAPDGRARARSSPPARSRYPPGLGSAHPDTLAALGVEKVMTMTSTYDHRVIQGAESGAFLGEIDRLLAGDDGFYEEVAREPRPVARRRHPGRAGPRPDRARRRPGGRARRPGRRRRRAAGGRRRRDVAGEGPPQPRPPGRAARPARRAAARRPGADPGPGRT